MPIPPISQQTVEQVADWLYDLEDESQALGLVDQMAEEQPLILAYLMAMGEGDFDENEREFLLFLGTAVWKMMSKSPTPLPVVTEETLDQAEATNLQMLEYLSLESEEGFLDFVKQLRENYAQPAIFDFVIEEVMEEPVLSEENQGMMMIFLKVVIDCLQG